MSLSKKIEELSEQARFKNEQSEKEDKEKELGPVRDKIKILEDQKYLLELIKGSLDLKSGNGNGIGMKEYSVELKKDFDNKENIIKAIINNPSNKEGLNGLGIKVGDDLEENENNFNENVKKLIDIYKEDEEATEVRDLLDAQNKKDDLIDSNNALKEKLKSTGINIDENNFSYNSVGDSLSGKLTSIESEILVEKLKTPEGREEAIDMIAKSLEKTLPNMVLLQNTATKDYTLQIGYAEISVNDRKGYSGISLNEKTTRFINSRNQRFLPENINELEIKYGKEVIKEAIKKVYLKEVDKDFIYFDEKEANITSLLADVERANPEKARQAFLVLSNFEKEADILQKEVDEKLKEFKDKDIIPRNGFHQAYAMLLKLTQYDNDTDRIKNILRNPSKFPPEFDWDLLKQKIEKRLEQNNKFKEIFLAISSQEEMDRFTNSDRNGTPKENSLWDFDTKIWREKDFFGGRNNQENINPEFNFKNQKGKDNLPNTFDAAKRYLIEKKNDFDKVKENVDKKVDMVIDFSLIKKNLEVELADLKIDGGIYNLDSSIEQVKKDKEKALSFMLKIVKLESELPKENFALRGRFIDTELRIKRREELNNIIKEEENKLNVLSKEVSEQKTLVYKSNLFNKSTRVKDLSNLEIKYSSIYKRIKEELEPERYNLSAPYVEINKEKEHLIENILNYRETIEGTPDKIFIDLKAKLTEVIDRKIPESIIRLNNEYKELLTKLNS
jgi:hypothetical protein